MSRHKHKLRFIGIFLSVILSVSSVPLYAFASGTYDTGGAAAEEVTVSCEYVAKRGEFEKHYLLSDGSFVAVSYPEAIHYRNADGEWEDIDSSVHAEASSSRIVTGDCGTFAASFSTGRRAGRLVSLSNREFSLSWSLSGDGERMVSSSPVLAASSSSVMQARAKISDSITGKPVSDSETFALRGASGSVGYSALFADAPEISAEYTVYRNKIEEDIYINSPTDLRSLRMEFDTAGLTAEVRDDGSVEFLDENGEMRFRIGIPYMEDAANEILTDIHVNAEQNGDSCTVTYTPDEEWLSSSERSYPILFDPSVTTDEYNSNIVDTYVAEGDTANHSGEQKLFYGVKSGKVHRVYIKINNLPALDPSMPVYGATMSLTYLDGTKTGKAVEIRRVNASWSPETITYANQPGYSAVLGSMAFDASKPVTFNLSSDVASLYDEYNAAENYGYVVKYVDEGKTNADYNGFWSADYTKAAKRPVLTVSYGYSLPSSLTNGSVYSFKNVGSGSFMTVHDGKDANYTNVYQKNTTVSNLTASQKFKLEQVSATGGYLLRAMCSSNGTNRVVDIQRVGTENYVKSGNNAYLYTATAPKTQQWFIVGVGTNQFKIVLRSNMNLALSAYGTANGTSGGNTSTSAGNVFLSTYSDSAYQRWEIVDKNGKNAECDSLAGKLQNGVYYLNNSHYRKYLHKNGTDAKVNGASGLISNLAGTIRWKLTQVGNDEYIIQSMADSSKYLYGSSAGYAYLGSNISASGGGISTAYRWEITHPRNDGGFLVKNVMTGRYLFQDGEDSVGLIGNTGNTEFEKKIRNWGIANVNYYGNDKPDKLVYANELKSGFTFTASSIEVGDTAALNVTKNPSNALWSNSRDFTFTKVETNNYRGNLIIDNSTQSIRGTKAGAVTIRAIHKVTGLSCVFSVEIKPKLEKDADYMLPDEIKKQLYVVRTAISNVESTGYSIEDKEMMIEQLEIQEDIIRADYILTGDNYSKAYAKAVIPNFDSVIDSGIDTINENLYRVVANRLLVLYGLKYSENETNTFQYFLDLDCQYDLWGAESQSALEWYYLSTGDGGNSFFNRTSSGIGPENRNEIVISSLQVFKYRHDVVKEFVAMNLGGFTEVSIPNIARTKKNGVVISYKGRADIVCSIAGGTAIWEVKPNRPVYYNNGIGTHQLKLYVEAANKAKNGKVSKGPVKFMQEFVAGSPISSFNLDVPSITEKDANIRLRVGPSPFFASIPYDSGLVLYMQVDDNDDGGLPVYSLEEVQCSLLQKDVKYALPSAIKVGVRDLIYTFAYCVVSGVVIGICIVYAPEIASAMSNVLAGIATAANLQTVTQAIAAGSAIAVPLSSYQINAIANMGG